MTGLVSIRFMRHGEEAEVCELIARVFNKYIADDCSPMGIKEFFEYAEPHAMVNRTEVGDRVLVAAEGSEIVGMLELKGLDHIAMLFVDAQGRGVGRSLVDRALQMCREGAVEQVRVHASRYAVPIYSKLGFEPEGPERTENGITYVPMVCELMPGG